MNAPAWYVVPGLLLGLRVWPAAGLGIALVDLAGIEFGPGAAIALVAAEARWFVSLN